jgi:putative redox protein
MFAPLDNSSSHIALHNASVMDAVAPSEERLQMQSTPHYGDHVKARIKWIEGVSFVAETESGHAIVVDGAPAAGGRNLGARPMELVLAGAAACTAFDVVWILKKARQPLADCVVDIEAERAPDDPKVFTRIHLVYRVTGTGLDRAHVERAVKLSKEKYCSATQMLAKTAEITFEIAVDA